MGRVAAWAGVLALLVFGGYRAMTNRAQLIMARTMYGEARGEGAEGMRAVGHVILNRARVGGWWGGDVVSVALKPSQFSAWNEGDPNREKIENLEPGQGNAVFDRAYAIAGDILAGRSADPTGGATHYHTSYVAPAWADPSKVTAALGGHVFYRGIA